MFLRRNPACLLHARTVKLTLVCLVFLACAFAGCKKHGRSVAPRFRKIDAMLSAKLPQGTSRARVVYFLSSRGYSMEDTPDKSSVIAIVQQVNTDTLQPVTARVTFHFDSNDRLTAYELQPGPEAPLRP
ncbi:MAG TPA: hypothetical protein VE077_05860 [Candidatus Methylomirabilis sp.]|nr:hypothetical protein [Candidatus Methylomirabilis sp.]